MRRHVGVVALVALWALGAQAHGGILEHLVDGCASIKDPIPVDFEVLKEVTNEWYTPYTSHFLWKHNYCGTTSYLHFPHEGHKGLEHQYFLHKDKVASHRGLPKNEWDKIVNHFTLDANNPGVSYWVADVELGFGLEIPSPKTKSYVVALEDGPRPRYWAAYYCSELDRGMVSEGWDVRSAELPLPEGVLEKAIADSRARGVPERLIAKMYEAPYQGCFVNNSEGQVVLYE